VQNGEKAIDIVAKSIYGVSSHVPSCGANEEHLAILKRGVKAWNQWREGYPDMPDLREADLRGEDLRGYPETCQHCCTHIKQHLCGNERHDNYMAQVFSA
jgi:hypothetical protein